MSTDSHLSLELRGAKRQGLRVALAVTVGLCMGLAMADPLPFLAPLFAAQFLLASRRPLTLRQGLATVLIILLSGVLLVIVTGLLRERPWVLLPILWLFYFACFTAQGQQLGGAGPALMLVIAIAVPLLDILHPDLGESIVLLLVKAVSVGIFLAWASHVLWPDPGDELTDVPSAPARDYGLVIRQATANAVILLGMVALCLTDPRLATALVVPITVTSVLGQLELNMGPRAGLGLVAVNLLGGVAASLAFFLIELRPTLWLVALVTLLVSLLFAGNAAMASLKGKIFGGGLIVFLVLFGLGLSPLPTGTAELFLTRLAYVLFAIVYSIVLAAVLWPRPQTIARPHG